MPFEVYLFIYKIYLNMELIIFSETGRVNSETSQNLRKGLTRVLDGQRPISKLQEISHKPLKISLFLFALMLLGYTSRSQQPVWAWLKKLIIL